MTNCAYRFGFNGQEKDDEVYGATGTSLHFTFREYDNRVARFFAIDPLAKEYPHYTPYQFAGLTPIEAREREGLEEWHTAATGDNPDVSPMRNDHAGPMEDSYAQGLGYNFHSGTETSYSGTFTEADVQAFDDWNSTKGPKQSGACLGCATRGSEMLTGVSAGWDNSNGNLSLAGKNVWQLGENLQLIGVAQEVTTFPGRETQDMMITSGNTGAGYSAFVAGPGGAYHSIIVTYNSQDVLMSLYDQGYIGSRNNSPEITQGLIDRVNNTATNLWGGAPSRMWRLLKREMIPVRIPIGTR